MLNVQPELCFGERMVAAWKKYFWLLWLIIGGPKKDKFVRVKVQ